MYSQGPWKLSLKRVPSGLIGYITANDDHPTEVCVLYCDDKVTKDNGSLIAAAPEMYELLEDLDEILATALHNGHHDLILRVKQVLMRAKTHHIP